MKKLLIATLLLTSCKKDTNIVPKSVLENTIWIMEQYMYEATIVPTTISDTCNFYDSFKYKFNQVVNDYTCTATVNGNYSVILYGTSFGNISGILPNEILNVKGQLQIKFSNLQTNRKIFIWIRKI